MSSSSIHTEGNSAPVGVFDSGVGGLSVLRHIHALLPQQDLLYFADSGFAPYGEKPESEIVARAEHIAEFLLARGARALVVACNTATVAAISVLRARYPGLALVGVEPGLKPAAALSQSRIVGVLATNSTLQGEKFKLLQQQISQETQVRFLLQPCTGLVQQIEQGELDSPATRELLQRYIPPLLAQGADTLVLGCTHYPFVRDQIERIIAAQGSKPVTLIDTGAAVARQLQRLLSAGQHLPQPEAGAASNASSANSADSPGLIGFTSGKATALSHAFAHLLNVSPPIVEVSSPESSPMSSPF